MKELPKDVLSEIEKLKSAGYDVRVADYVLHGGVDEETGEVRGPWPCLQVYAYKDGAEWGSLFDYEAPQEVWVKALGDIPGAFERYKNKKADSTVEKK